MTDQQPPSEARPAGPAKITLSLDREELALLDTWISVRAENLSRPEALRRLALAKLRVELDSGD